MIAHFHYVLFGVIVFATYAGVYFWFPKMTGRMLDERLGKLHFWLTMIGFNVTFLVQHWLGDEGMPRRYADYLPTDGFTTLNIVSSVGAFIVGISLLPFAWNIFKSWRYGEVVTVDDPWGHGNSLRGHLVPAAAAQLHRAADHPFRAAGLRAALSAHGRPDAGRGPRRPVTPSGDREGESPIFTAWLSGEVGNLVAQFLPARRTAAKSGPARSISRDTAGSS